MKAASRALTGQVAALLLGRSIAFAITFATPMVLVRVFSTADYGLYKQLLLVFETALPVLALGLGASLYYLLPNFPRHRDEYVTSTIGCLLLSGAVGGGLLVLFRGPTARLVNNAAAEPLMPIVAVFIACSLVAALLESLMVIAGRAVLAAVTSVLSDALRAALVIAAALLTSSVALVLAALLLWSVCRVVATAAYLKRTRFRWAVSLECVRGQAAYAFPVQLALIAKTVADTLPLYVIAHRFPPAIFAVYAVGFLQIPLVPIAFESMSEVVLVRLTELQRDRMPRRGAILIQGLMGRLGMVLLPLYVFMLFNARAVMTLLYTDRFAAAVPVFQVVLTLIPLTVVALDYVPRAFADTRFVLAVNVCRLLVTVVALALLVDRFGAVGAALAAVTGTAAAKGLAMLRARRLLGVPLARLIPWMRLGYVTGAAVAAVVVASLVRGALGTGPVALVGWLIVFAVCYGAAVWSAGALTRKEREAMVGLLDAVGVRALFQRARANS